MQRRVRLVALLAVVAVLAGCVGGPPAPDDPPAPTTVPPTATAPASVADRCTGAVDPPEATPFVFPAADGTPLVGIEFGADSGDRAVIALNQTNLGLCGWLDFAPQLAEGLRVLVFDHRCTEGSGCPAGGAALDLLSDVEGARAYLTGSGATSVSLLGASRGAALALAAAGSGEPFRFAHVVALSGARFGQDFGGGVTAEIAIPSVRAPVLYLVADTDPTSPVTQTTDVLADAAPDVVTLEVLPGSAHGWDVVADPVQAERVVEFLIR